MSDPNTNLGFLDKLFLWRKSPVSSQKISKRFSIIETRDLDEPIVLKFSYLGNAQFHALNLSEIKILSRKLSELADTQDRTSTEKRIL